MNKPKILYHGSTSQNIQVLEPREEDPKYGKILSATQYKQIAAMYLSPRGFPTIISRFGDDFTIVVQAKLEDFAAADKGGAIYTISSDGFECDTAIGMQESEWRSIKAAKPLKVEIFSSARAAMTQVGARLYLVNEATVQAIQTSKDHGWQIMQSLRPIQ